MISRSEAADLLTDVEIVDTGGAGSVVALAHGAAGGVRENFAPVLAAGRLHHRFTGAYHPGAGLTPLDASALRLDVLADRLVATGVAAGADRFPLVGMSLGAAIAVTAAHRHPEHVSGLVLTVGVSAPDAQSVAAVSTITALAAGQDRRALGAALLLACTTADQLAAIPHGELDALLDLLADEFPAGGTGQLSMVHDVDVRPLLTDLSVPALVVVAGQDRLVLPATSRAFGAIAGSRTIEYPDAGHVFDASHGRRWATDVLGFLETL